MENDILDEMITQEELRKKQAQEFKNKQKENQLKSLQKKEL